MPVASSMSSTMNSSVSTMPWGGIARWFPNRKQLATGSIDPVDVEPEQPQQLPAHHGDFGRVDAEGAEDRAAPALGALVEVVEPLLDDVDGQLAAAGQLAEDLAQGGEVLAVDGSQQLGPQHRHVLRVAAADEEVALVGTGPAADADVHEELERAVLLQPLRHPLQDDLLPVVRQLPVVVGDGPLPAGWADRGSSGSWLARIDVAARPEIRPGVSIQPVFGGV